MIIKSFFLLLSCILVVNFTTAMEGMNTRDMNSIEMFFNNIHKRALSDYQVEKVLISINDKKNILKMIFFDLSDILTELNKMSVDSHKELSSGYLVSFISDLEKLEPNNEFFQNRKLSGVLKKIFSISEAINSYVEPLKQLGGSNIFDQDVLKFCPTKKNGRQDVQFEFERQVILNKYKEFVQNLKIMVDDDRQFNVCGQTPSLNQAVFNYFHQVIAIYLKEYVMLYYIDIIDARCLNFNAAQLLRTRQDESLIELKETVKLTKLLLNRTNHYMHKCDIDYSNQSNSKFYLELKHMIQTVIIEELKMSTTESCKHNCDLNSIKGTLNYKNYQEFHDCRFIGNTINYCQSYNKQSFLWLEGNGNYYGNSNQCHGIRGSVSKSFTLFKFADCDQCVCSAIKKIHDDSAVTAISFREQVSDIRANKVVVGVRFVQKSNLIHIQIKEGFLKPNGVTKSSWKALENLYSYSKLKKFRIFNNTVGWQSMKQGEDYGEARFINFDDMIAPEGFVVTGVRFKLSQKLSDKKRSKFGTIQLQIRVSPYDYIKGVVYEESTRWIVPGGPSNRQELTLRNPDRPTKAALNIVNSNPIQFIKFQASDFNKDAGQSTVPFFDAQDVVGDPEFPLGGIGLVHRGREGFGGFLAFKIYDLNLSKYFIQ